MIKCQHIDTVTGATECFVINRIKNRGCWQLEESVEQSALILERTNRIEAQQKIFKDKLKNTLLNEKLSREKQNIFTVLKL